MACLRRFYRRSPSPTRRGTRRCTSWPSSETSPRCHSPASPPGPTTCRPCTCQPPCCWPRSAGSTSAPLRHRHKAPVTCRDSENPSTLPTTTTTSVTFPGDYRLITSPPLTGSPLTRGFRSTSAPPHSLCCGRFRTMDIFRL